MELTIINSELVRAEKNNCCCVHGLCMKNAWKTVNIEMLE